MQFNHWNNIDVALIGVTFHNRWSTDRKNVMTNQNIGAWRQTVLLSVVTIGNSPVFQCTNRRQIRAKTFYRFAVGCRSVRHWVENFQKTRHHLDILICAQTKIHIFHIYIVTHLGYSCVSDGDLVLILHLHMRDLGRGQGQIAPIHSFCPICSQGCDAGCPRTPHAGSLQRVATDRHKAHARFAHWVPNDFQQDWLWRTKTNRTLACVSRTREGRSLKRVVFEKGQEERQVKVWAVDVRSKDLKISKDIIATSLTQRKIKFFGWWKQLQSNTKTQPTQSHNHNYKTQLCNLNSKNHTKDTQPPQPHGIMFLGVSSIVSVIESVKLCFSGQVSMCILRVLLIQTVVVVVLKLGVEMQNNTQ